MKVLFLIFTTFLLFSLVSTCPGQPTVNAGEGGTVRIPYYFAKRRTFKITVPARLTGTMAGYPTPGFPIPIFTTALNLSGTVTLVFNRKEDGSTSPIYALGSVTYNFPAPGK
jgi:hypothetical protein